MNSVEGRISIVLEGSTFDGLPLDVVLKAYGLALVDKKDVETLQRVKQANEHVKVLAKGEMSTRVFDVYNEALR